MFQSGGTTAATTFPNNVSSKVGTFSLSVERASDCCAASDASFASLDISIFIGGEGGVYVFKSFRNSSIISNR